MTEQQIESALDICRRLPPQKINSILQSIIKMRPELSEPLLSLVDRPLSTRKDSDNRDFIVCEYNRDGDSYRSPWNNKYTDNFAGIVPPRGLRSLEIGMNEAFGAFLESYYREGVSSVYLWDAGKHEFGGVVLLKKSERRGEGLSSTWDSVHVFEARTAGRSCVYRLISTIMLWMHSSSGVEVNMGGNLTCEDQRHCPLSRTHLVNIGSFVESQENRLRARISAVYFDKSLDLVNSLRRSDPRQTTRSAALTRLNCDLAERLLELGRED